MKRKKLYIWLSAIALTVMAGMAQAADAGLDRAALLKLADTYLAALVAHDPGKVPLAGDVKVVENVKRIKPGEGLWKTATSGPTEFKIVVPDPVTAGSRRPRGDADRRQAGAGRFPAEGGERQDRRGRAPGRGDARRQQSEPAEAASGHSRWRCPTNTRIRTAV